MAVSTAVPMRRGKPVDRLVSALLAGDRDAAWHLVAATQRPGVTRGAVISDLVQPAQERIGELWYAGSIGVADEHRATGIVEEILARLDPTPSAVGVRPGARCLLAALGDEQHVLGLRALRMVLEDDGWACEYLGGTVPAAELLRVNQDIRADVVLLSASYAPDRAELAGAIRHLRGQGSATLVGGAALGSEAGLWKRLGAHGYGPDARVAQYLARRLSQS
jgi:methanogenic corrinoid protein MtbC1